MPWVFQTGANEEQFDNQLYLGVELEMSIQYDGAVWLESHKPAWLSLTYDSSISPKYGHTGRELQFHPSTYTWWTEKRSVVLGLLSTLRRRYGATSGNDTHCGLHIHFSRVMPDAHVLNIMQLIYTHQVYCLKLSRRTRGAMDHYAAMAKTSDVIIDSNGQVVQDFPGCTCSLCIAARGYHRVEGKIDSITREDMWRCSRDKYSAVYLHYGGRTIEVRLFSGTVTTNELYTGLQFVHAAIAFTNPQRGYNPETDCDMTKFHAFVRASGYCTLRRAMGHKALAVLEAEHA